MFNCRAARSIRGDGALRRRPLWALRSDWSRRAAQGAFSGAAGIERLEERAVLAMGSITLYPDSGLVWVAGSSRADNLSVQFTEGQEILVMLSSPEGLVRRTFAPGQVASLLFHGRDGDDQFSNQTAIPSTVYGGSGNDILLGGNGPNTLSGDVGDDVLRGGSARSVLSGGAGDDRLYGGSGNDSISGGAGHDRLYGGSGDDSLDGGLGDDQLRGGAGHDSLDGGEGNDWLFGNTGDDRLRSGAGDDWVYGEDGRDTIFGDDGADVLLGGAGQDTIDGGAGADLLVGGLDADQLNGGTGGDLLIGGRTTYDNLGFALRDLLSRWQTQPSYLAGTRQFQSPQSPQSPMPLIVNEQVHDDHVVDQAYGGLGRDWFVVPGRLPVDGAESPLPVEAISWRRVILGQVDQIADLEAHELVQSAIPFPVNQAMQQQVLALMDLVPQRLVTHRAVASGNWSNPGTWQNGSVPISLANVAIPSGVTVTVDQDLSNTALRSVRLEGKLRFDSTRNTALRVETLVGLVGSQFEMGTAAQPIAPAVRARLIIADPGSLDRVFDPLGIGRGLISLGTVTMYGSAKTEYVALSGSLAAGATQLRLDQVPSGWRVGDRLVIAGTRSDRHESEVRPILSLSGSLVTIAPLAFDHQSPPGEARIHVANLTRNATIESATEVVARRGHVLFLGTSTVDIANGGFYNLGRTNKSVAANDPTLSVDGSLLAGSGTNGRGRYALHFQQAGVIDVRQAARVRGSVVDGSPGWGFVNDGGYVDMTHNVAYDVRGAAFVGASGNEVGTWSRNLALYSVGTSIESTARDQAQDLGYQGHGFWLQGPGIRLTDNVAADQSGDGFVLWTRGIVRRDGVATPFLAERMTQSSLALGAATLPVDSVPLAQFQRNVVYASAGGVAFHHHLKSAGHNGHSVVSDLLLWNNRRGVRVEDSGSIDFQRVHVITPNNASVNDAVRVDAMTTGVTFLDLRVDPPVLVARPVAFPGAEGMGALALGGRGGDVYHVTNLRDIGIGSLRHGIESAQGPRTIVFDVSGTITLAGGLAVQKPYLTIAGQTAPGDGITIKGYELAVQDTHDIVIRHLRFRPGDVARRHNHGVKIANAQRVIMDHVSVSWGTNETLLTYGSTDVTVQWSIISEGLYDSYNISGKPLGSGSLHYDGAITLHHNLYAHNALRSPDVTQDADIVNNVVYNWTDFATLVGYSNSVSDPNGPTRANVQNNYYVAGPDTRFFAFSEGDLTFAVQGKVGATIWQAGNVQDDTRDGVMNGREARFVGPHAYASQRFAYAPVAVESAVAAYFSVLGSAGASVRRDAVDQRIVQDVLRQTGHKIDSQSEVGGWPLLQSSAAPVDTDQDGMPDVWEARFAHLDPRNSADRNGDHNADGYTNLEEYLHDLTVRNR